LIKYILGIELDFVYQFTRKRERERQEGRDEPGGLCVDFGSESKNESNNNAVRKE